MLKRSSRITVRPALLAGLLVIIGLLAGCGDSVPPVALPTTAPQQTADVQAAATPLLPALPSPTDSAASSGATPSPAGSSPTDQTPVATLTPGEIATAETPSADSTPPTECEPTPSDQLGPFYEPDAPVRNSVGQGHILTGIVRSGADCLPIAGAQIELWLAGPDGQYGDDYRAALFSDQDGAYRFESNAPPPYSGRPPHIHIRVTADGYELLVTQYYPPPGQVEGAFDLVLVPQATTPAGASQTSPQPQAPAPRPSIQEYPVPAGSGPHDVAPAPDGTVWYTAQRSGELGRLDPGSGATRHVRLGNGSAPHGVIVGPDGAPWIADSGLNAIVRVDPVTEGVRVFPILRSWPCPAARPTSANC